MANPSFVDALSSIRRKAQLSGRTLSKQETSGAVAGFAETASVRLARGRQSQREDERLELATRSDERQHDIAKKQMKQDRRRDTATGVIAGGVAGGFIGAKAGAAAGVAFGGPVGGAIGAVVGFVASKVCIIISACSGPESYEVEISRRYRDRYMTNFELIGYYTIAPTVAGLIHRHRPIKRFVKTQLVDRMVDYGEWVLHLKPAMDHPVLSKFVTKSFLSLCRTVGKYQAERREVAYHG
jgi:hypothetical protein